MLIFSFLIININKAYIMNILDTLQKHLENIPNKVLYRFEEREESIYSLTFSELDNKAKKVANYLTQNYQKGERRIRRA